MSVREFRVIREWMRGEWNRPSRSDHYMMQLALIQAQRGGSKKTNVSDMKIEFKSPKPVIQRKLTRKELDEMSDESLQLWIARLGGKKDQ